ncbi:hypothetical protein ACFOSC_02390 [Streptantibioticus rubrisoli]|uniref:Secreted protein n=1 Tax=Streptantibioticus rubrisoli TaxID=1387313 RepID=A0ABT1PKY8_9ACTN|nr:hypothetical protein [Streptantibioticus rubrisoli]MCQ4046027.1 hypothetical protein [Streptantibioticus rubrisoli]
MRTGQTKRTGSRATAVVLAAALGLALAGCGSGGAKSRTASASSSTAPASTASGAPAAPADPSQVLATIKGPDGIVLTINSAKREAGGFVTVTGTVKNTGSQPFSQAGSWRGDEEELQKNGGSLAGATLVDTLGKKRYYVLRDTEGRCLCSTGLDIIQPGATMPVFAQFPAPPATTTQVDFDLPTLPTASIVISQ